VAKEHGAKTIALSKEGMSMIDNVTDIKLCVMTDSEKKPYSGRVNRIVQLSIVEALTTYLTLRRGEAAKEAELQGRKATERKMY